MNRMAGREEGRQPVSEHLDELRRRLFVAAVATVGTTVVAFVFHRQVLKLLIRPAEAVSAEGPTLIYTSVTEMLGISMKVSLLGGLVLALPLLVYEIVMFVSPGLTPREKRLLFLFLPGVLVAFVSGVVFGYFILIPPAMRFLLSFNTDIATPFITIGNYVNLMVNLLVWLGLVFETPVLMYVLAKLRVASYKTFARWRKMAIVLAFVLGGMITPTFDPINQSLVAVPIIVLYELGVWLAWLARRRERSLQVGAGEAS